MSIFLKCATIRIGDVMIEVIDKDSDVKMMALLLCGILYGECRYVIFAIRRDKIDANLFVSKLVKNSNGYVIDTDFQNGEKEVMDSVVQRLLNHESREKIKENGFLILDDISLEGTQYYDVEKCYVSSVPLICIKELMKYYSFIRESLFEQPILDVQEDKRIFNEGFFSNIILILFGIIVIIFCVFVLIKIFIK